MTNYSERAARNLKAQRLARAIRALNMGLTADDAANFPLKGDVWQQLAELATELEIRDGAIEEGEIVHPPHSQETVRAVCDELRWLERKAS
jgi:threonine aldolase